MKTGDDQYDDMVIKEDIVLPWETPAGTDYGTERLSDAEVRAFADKEVPLPDVKDWVTIESISGNAWRLTNEEKEKELAKYGVTLEQYNNAADEDEILREWVVDGVSHRISVHNTGQSGGIRIEAYKSVDLKRSVSFLSSSDNTSGVNVADEWIDVYYYYTLDHVRVYGIEVIDEE